MASASAYVVDSRRSAQPGMLRLAITLVAIATAYVGLAWDNLFAAVPW